MTSAVPLSLRPMAAVALAALLAMALLPVAPSTVTAQEDATDAVVDAFDVTGEVGAEDVAYHWVIGESTDQWRIELEGPADRTMRLALSTGDEARDPVDHTSGAGQAVLNDLALEAGSWIITVESSGNDPVPFELRALPEPEPFDVEPNDGPSTAVTMEDGDEVRGRLGRTDQDEDLYRLIVPAGEPEIRDVTLAWSADIDRRLCLRDGDDRDRKCASGQRSATLLGLRLEPGDHYLSVSGPEDASVPYVLRIEPVGPLHADDEAEPNDDVLTASPFQAELGVTGRSARDDPDFHRVDIVGKPQLWSVRASGDQLHELSWVRGGEDVLAATPNEDGLARLDDLYLVPGRHYFRVRTLGGEYRLEMIPLGPPDPDAEREPNNEDVRAESYGIGERKVGRLVTGDDIDRFRFTLAAPDHVRIHLQQPPDADLSLRLNDSGGEFLRRHALDPGGPMDLDLWLRPGDYLLSLQPRTASDGEYELTSERLDPFILATDQEPNDEPVVAREAPPSLEWDGWGHPDGDVDGTWLPPLDRTGALTIRLDGTERATARLYAGEYELERLSLDRQGDGSLRAEGVPEGVPLYLEITADDAYSVALEAAGWTPTPSPEAPSAALAIDLEPSTVAAYWPQAQRVDGRVVATNVGTDDVRLELKTTTSHYAWKAVPERTVLEVPAGSSTEVPIRVDVRPDAWAGVPVRVSVAASDADGGEVTVGTVLEASPEAAPVQPVTGWGVPEALLGGLDVAWLGLGAEPRIESSDERERYLFDGVTPEGAGFGIDVREYPLELVTDLAGDEPVPIAGIALNPLARGFRIDQVVRDFELALSTDGETWASVLRGRLQPMPIDQYFVLSEPILATHARLSIHSDHSDDRRSNRVVLGEWKVIAAPGATPEPMPVNIADPARGGHVVRFEPFGSNFKTWYSMVDPDPRQVTLSTKRSISGRDDLFEVIVGFQDGRAAQVTRLGWLDPDGSDAELRLDRVDVQISVDGPIGPWQSLGDWRLERTADGSVAPFELDSPTWARYLRLSSPLDPEARQVEAPAAVEVIERATDDGYRSILGEWGYTSRRGPYEWLAPEATAAIEVGPDAGDSRETATVLTRGTPWADRAEILKDVDWYRIVVPPESNVLRLDIRGVPRPDVKATVLDDSGAEVEMRLVSQPGGTQSYQGDVVPGTYDVLVEQVPFNVAFTFDTSGSMGPFLDFVLEGMREFAGDVQPGREVVTIVPFGVGPLLDSWQDQPDVLEDAVNSFLPGGSDSSNAEQSLLVATRELASREGTRAILVVTDAETGSLDQTPQLWAAFEEVAPVVYSVHVGASNEPFETRNLMRSWADANTGHYAFPATHAEMERAFERMTTRLRRPAVYELTATTEFMDRSPGTLAVLPPPDEAVALAPGVGLGIIVDTSGSMRKWLDGRRRIAIAKGSLRTLLGKTLAEGTPVAVRTLGPGGKRWKCRSRLELPLAPLDRAQALAWVKTVRAPKNAGTPISHALAAMAEDLAGLEERIVVLITDGNESCGGDPAATIASLAEAGVETSVNIVGFALDDAALKARMAEWAEAGEGRYFDAASADDLQAAIEAATSARFAVFVPDADEPLAQGTVGGEPVTLEPGPYRVEVRTDPPASFEVEVAPGSAEVVEVPPASADQ